MQPETQVVERQVRYHIERPPTLQDAGALLKQLMPLLAKCWQPYQEAVGINFNPDWGDMVDMLAKGTMIIVTAKDGAEVVGFQMWTLHAYYYSMGTKVATMHRIYGGRKQGVDARAFLKFAMQMMKQFGARTALFGGPPGSAVEKLFRDVGAKPMDILYAVPLWPVVTTQQPALEH